MTRIVQSELRHLPRGGVGSPQNEMRKLYNSRRRHDIAADKARRETLRFCLQVMKNKYPSFLPEYDQSFFRRVEETPRRGLIQRFRIWRKDGKSANELLKVIIEEKERSSSLESELIAEKEKRRDLEKELRITKGKLVKREIELKRSDKHIHLIEEELTKVLEVCLLSFLKDHKGTISIKDYANELNVRETQIRDTLNALAKKGQIKIEL